MPSRAGQPPSPSGSRAATPGSWASHSTKRSLSSRDSESRYPNRDRMNEQILINVTPQETRVAVTEQGAVQELHVERGSSRGLVGNIYLGRVCRVLPGMQSAFVEI